MTVLKKSLCRYRDLQVIKTLKFKTNKQKDCRFIYKLCGKKVFLYLCTYRDLQVIRTLKFKTKQKIIPKLIV